MKNEKINNYIVVVRERENDLLVDGEKFENYNQAKAYINELKKEYNSKVYFELTPMDKKISKELDFFKKYEKVDKYIVYWSNVGEYEELGKITFDKEQEALEYFEFIKIYVLKENQKVNLDIVGYLMGRDVSYSDYKTFTK